MNARTAELYSEQGNTDLKELMVIDETTQCKKCKEHSAKGKSFRTCGVILQEFSTEKTNTLKETTAQVMTRLRGFAVAKSGQEV